MFQWIILFINIISPLVIFPLNNILFATENIALSFIFFLHLPEYYFNFFYFETFCGTLF